MNSRITCIPSYIGWQRSDVQRRVAQDALDSGILFPPDPATLPEAGQRMLTGQNIFADWPKGRRNDGISLYCQHNLVVLVFDLQKRTSLTWEDIGDCGQALQILLKVCGGSLDAPLARSLYSLDVIFDFAGEKIALKYILQRIVQKIPSGHAFLCLSSDGIQRVSPEGVETGEDGVLTKNIKDMRVLDSVLGTEAQLAVCLKVTPPDTTRNRIGDPECSFLDEDTRRCQLPPLDAGMLTDSSRGIWAAFWPETSQPDTRYYMPMELEQAVVAANPWDAVRHGSHVAIDFGTSSTVAAVREADGRQRLLRIGGELGGVVTARQYENPTALEFVDVERMLVAWQREPWRPLIQWEDVKCSHQARHELGSAERAACGMRSIKTWARKLPEQPPLRLRDEKGHAFELSPLPVETDEAMHDIGDIMRPLDPIELYACFLGFSLNNQLVHGGVIYPRYYLTFPVKFDRHTRDRILQGFRRGLLRSLPPSLVYGQEWQAAPPFRIREIVSEPVAFAAGVLPSLDIAPTEDGVAFGVFDFGGGTTDFAFGLYRLATLEENENEGWESVLDILDVAGDEQLGGEHLLELAAWHVIRDNAENLLAAETAFLCPAGLELFDGSELLFTASTEAQANTVVLREAMRPLWEEGSLGDDDSGTLSLTLTTRSGKGVTVSLRVDADALRAVLKQRIRQGVSAFFTTFRQAFKTHSLHPEKLHVLLAGNSCRSPLVQDVFAESVQELLPEHHELITLHRELLPGAEEQAAGTQHLTLKTGVALGLLRVLPGEPVGMVERNRNSVESPFLFTVGMFRNDMLLPVLQRNAPYGEWQRLPQKVIRSGITRLGYSASPQALEEDLRRADCRELEIEWDSALFGRRICLRADDPRHISVALEVADSSGEGDISVDESTLRRFELRS